MQPKVATQKSEHEVNWLARELPNPEDQREYARQRAIVAISEAIGEELEAAHLTRSELAKILGVSKGRISRALQNRNLTIGTIAEMLWACNLEISGLQTAKLGVSVAAPMPEFGTAFGGGSARQVIGDKDPVVAANISRLAIG